MTEKEYTLRHWDVRWSDGGHQVIEGHFIADAGEHIQIRYAYVGLIFSGRKKVIDVIVEQKPDVAEGRDGDA